MGLTVARLLAAAFFLAWIVSSIHEALPPSKLVKWRAIEGSAAAAAVEHKPILYDFSADWCGPCKKMEKHVFADREAASLINGSFVPVRVADEDTSPAAAALREAHGVDSLPTLLVVREAKGQPRRLEGFHDAHATVAFLKRALAQQ